MNVPGTFEDASRFSHYARLAAKALKNEILTRPEIRSVLRCPDDELLLLLRSAFRVREHFFGRRVHLHLLMNAKSGLCPEDCAYCSQSSVSTAPVEKYPLRSKAQILQAALKAKEAKALRFCIVTSGRRPTPREVGEMAEVVREVKRSVDIQVCCCMGLLDEESARALKAAGVDRVNHNLNTSRGYHSEICTTHTYSDRMKTLSVLKKVGLSICCGGIIGMGEDEGDIIDLALALRVLDVDSIPVNFLHPIPGTPLESSHQLTPQFCLKVLCLFRFLNPDKEIRVAGGREFNLRSLQALSLYPANSMFVDGYLTTGGQGVYEAHQMIEDLGFEIETGSEIAAPGFSGDERRTTVDENVDFR